MGSEPFRDLLEPFMNLFEPFRDTMIVELPLSVASILVPRLLGVTSLALSRLLANIGLGLGLGLEIPSVVSSIVIQSN